MHDIQYVLHKWWPVSPLSATDRDGWPELPITSTAPGLFLIVILVVSGAAGGHGVGELGASGGCVARRQGLGGTSGGPVQHPGQRLSAPSQVPPPAQSPWVPPTIRPWVGPAVPSARRRAVRCPASRLGEGSPEHMGGGRPASLVQQRPRGAEAGPADR